MGRKRAVFLTKDECAADDLMQDAYLRCFKKAHQFKPGTSLQAWILTIIFTTFVNHYRAKQRKASHAKIIELDRDEVYMQVQGDFPDGQQVMEGQGVADLLDKLPVKQKTALAMRLEGYSYLELADNLGVPIGTVKSRVHQAKITLRKHLVAA